jgi:hypothetical protein
MFCSPQNEKIYEGLLVAFVISLVGHYTAQCCPAFSTALPTGADQTGTQSDISGATSYLLTLRGLCDVDSAASLPGVAPHGGAEWARHAGAGQFGAQRAAVWPRYPDTGSITPAPPPPSFKLVSLSTMSDLRFL